MKVILTQDVRGQGKKGQLIDAAEGYARNFLLPRKLAALTEKYMTPHSYYGIAIEGQPEEQIYYHRSIQDIFNLCFRAGFVIDGFYEECFKNNKEIPMVMIVRLKKVKRDSLK